MNQAILQTTPELKFAICEDSPAHLSHNHQILRRNLGDAQPVFSLYISGKELLDILIKMKYPKIISRNISITVSGNFHGISYMEPMDICIIFSNALDNAIEACEKISDNPYIFPGIKKFSLYARASKLPNQQITVLHKIHNILKSQTL